MKLRRYTYKLTIFYMREQINLSVAQIKLCLDAKHWDPNVWTIARRIAFIAPNCCQIVYLEPSPLKYSCLFLLLIVREFTSTSLPPPLSTTMRCPARHVVVFVAGHRHHCCPDVSSTATAIVSTAQRPLLPPSMLSLFPRLLPLTCCHGHDLLLRKSLF